MSSGFSIFTNFSSILRAAAAAAAAVLPTEAGEVWLAFLGLHSVNFKDGLTPCDPA